MAGKDPQYIAYILVHSKTVAFGAQLLLYAICQEIFIIISCVHGACLYSQAVQEKLHSKYELHRTVRLFNFKVAIVRIMK